MDVTLIGGGWDPDVAAELYGPFLRAAAARATDRQPVVACVLVDEGHGDDEVRRWTDVLRGLADVATRPVLVPLGDTLEIVHLDGIDGVLVGGGLTPAYADAVSPVADELRRRVLDGLPYAGFSAGAAIAARRAVVGGWRVGDEVVCDEDVCEDLDQVTVVDGLGLVDRPIDVHAAEWGTIDRLAAVLRRDRLPTGDAIDEGTALHLTGDGCIVLGDGAVHRLTTDGRSELRAGDRC